MKQKMPFIIFAGMMVLLNLLTVQGFGVTVDQMKLCEPNEYTCGFDDTGNDVVKQCNPQGTDYELIQTCKPYEDCRLNVDNDANCIDRYKKDSSQNYFVWGLVIALLIILIIVLTRKKK